MKKYFRSVAYCFLLIGLAVAGGYADEISYTYDQVNRLVKEAHSDGTIVQYGYDEVGNRLTLSISKNTDLKAGFTASPTSGPLPLAVNFTDQSTGTINSWSWNFGDGTTGTSQNPSHTYTSAGTFTVTLTVSSGGQSSSQSATIKVNSTGPAAAFNVSPDNGSAPLTVQFMDASTGTVTGWSWSFGDGGISTSQNPSHTYASPGTYTASLTVTDATGSSGPVYKTITVDPAEPGADFRAFPSSGTTPLDVTFTNNSDGIITGWSWTFGDGTTSNIENPVHTYTSPGTYVTTLTVTGPNGYSSSKSLSITVNPVIAPAANFDATPTSGMQPLAVSFTDTSTGTITSWSWNFGDGATSNSRNPDHTYTSAGTYTATLIATGPTGQTSTHTEQITVNPSPLVANFSATPNSGAAPLIVYFTDASTGPVTSWSWDLGDGSTSKSRNPSHLYSAPGIYSIGLTVTGPGGSSTKTLENFINIAPDYGIDVYTKLMLHFNGYNGSRTFIDSEQTPKTITGYGNAQISTTYSKFGGASLKLDGSSSYLRVPASPDWNFSGDFTIDFWWYHTTGTNNPIIKFPGYSLNISETSGVVKVWMSSNGSSWDIANGVSMGTASGTGFDHYALVRAGDTYYTFQNGNLVNSIMYPFPPYYNASNVLNIGADPGYTYAVGYLDELRITNGDVRWLSNFTPPGVQYTVGTTPPAASFSANSTSGPAPHPVQFTDTSTEDITSWAWDFGDGSTSTQQFPNHTYMDPGTYTVSLTVTGPGGADTDTQTGYITVSTPSTYGIDDYTKLMLHFNGYNGSRTFIDSEQTPKTITGYGNAQISTTYSKFGGASLKLDGSSGSYLRVPASPDWNFSGDFTIDFWWYHTTGTNNPIIKFPGYSLNISEQSGVVKVYMSSNGSSWDIANGVSMGTASGTGFDHYALVRAGDTYYTFQNGNLVNSIMYPFPPYYNASNVLNIGADPGYTHAAGYLDELRITNGDVRWLSNFTPPTSEYTAE